MTRDEYLVLLKEKTNNLTEAAEEFHHYIQEHKNEIDLKKSHELWVRVDQADKEWLELARNPNWDK